MTRFGVDMEEGKRVAKVVSFSIEWSQGYTSKFGLQYVNLTTQERAYKASFFEFANLFQVYQET